jgi:hypothetical protein
VPAVGMLEVFTIVGDAVAPFVTLSATSAPAHVRRSLHDHVASQPVPARF